MPSGMSLRPPDGTYPASSSTASTAGLDLGANAASGIPSKTEAGEIALCHIRAPGHWAKTKLLRDLFLMSPAAPTAAGERIS